MSAQATIRILNRQRNFQSDCQNHCQCYCQCHGQLHRQKRLARYIFLLAILLAGPHSQARDQARDRARIEPVTAVTEFFPNEVAAAPKAQPQVSPHLMVPVQSLADSVKAPRSGFSGERFARPGSMFVSVKHDLILDRVRSINQTLGVCACGLNPQSRVASRRPLGKTSVKDARGSRFAISVVNFEMALRIFHYLVAQEQIPFGYPQDGCFARAHEMSYLLERYGIVTGKVMATGAFRIESDRAPKGSVSWAYHVAPVVVVDDGSGRKIWVLDPSLFSEPVPLEMWLTMLLNHPRAKLKQLYLTNRYVFHPALKNKNLNAWNPEHLKSARRLLKRFSDPTSAISGTQIPEQVLKQNSGSQTTQNPQRPESTP